MDKDGLEDATQMEINICNTDASSQIVLNDLQLLELLYSYPFLFSKAVHTHGDKDYEEWGWQEIAKEFNMRYKGLELKTLFTVEELQWRWEVLRPICPSLGKACGQIPDSLWYIICKINRLMNTKLPVRGKQLSQTQKLILNQLPIMEHLTESQQRRLEVEILDAILTHERSLHLEVLNVKTRNIVQNQYDEFLRAIRVKELPLKHNLSNSDIVYDSERTFDIDKLSSRVCFGSTTNTDIVNSSKSNLVISSVCRLLDSQDEDSTNRSLDTEINPVNRQEVEVKQETNPGGRFNTTDETVLYVFPLKSAKYYTKKVKVKVKRLNLEEHMPLAKIKKLKENCCGKVDS